MIYANLPVILSYFRREEEEYIRMILDQFRFEGRLNVLICT